MTVAADSYRAGRQAQEAALRDSLKALGQERLIAPAPPPALTPVSTPKKRKTASENTPLVTPDSKARRTDGGGESTPGSGRRSSRVKEALERAESGEEMRRSASFNSGLMYEEEDDGDEDGTPRRLKGRIHNPKKFGHQPGIPVGKVWQSRMACSNSKGARRIVLINLITPILQDAIHAPPVGGIAGSADVGAWSVCISGGYEDDLDVGYSFTYTGSGGRDLSGTSAAPKNLRVAPNTFDQTFTKVNAALQKSSETAKPIRVIRGYKATSPFAPESGYRYDGLYQCKRAWLALGESGFKVCRFAFVRLDGQPDIPVKAGREEEAAKIIEEFGKGSEAVKE